MDEVFAKQHSLFRLISTLLHKLPQDKFEFTELDQEDTKTQHQSYELKVIRSVAILSVIHTDVIAMSTEISPGKINLFACSEDQEVNPPSSNSSQSWNILGTPNSITTIPGIFSYTLETFSTIPPKGLSENDDPHKVVKYLIDRDYRIPRPLSLLEHLWMLGKLMFQNSSWICFYNTVATCYPKMLFRFNHSISNTYMKLLNNKMRFQYDMSLVQPLRSSKPFAFDIEYINQFIVHNIVSSDFPHLISQGHKVLENKSDQWYTQETCHEFHNLLITHLSDCHNNLKRLKALDQSLGKSDNAGPEFELCVRKIALDILGLHRLSQGAAFDLHMRTIFSPINDTILPEEANNDFVDNDFINSNNDNDAGDGPDDALVSTGPNARPYSQNKRPLWQSCKEWIKVLVSQFEAMTVVMMFTGKMKGSIRSASIQLLLGKLVENKNENPGIWKTLFDDLIPKDNNKGIFNHLEKAAIVSSEELKVAQRVLTNTLKACHDKNASKAQEILKELCSSSLPGWSATVDITLKNLASEQIPLGVLNTIHSMLNVLPFYQMLKTMEDGSWTFSGTVHCEASLCSLMKYSVNTRNDATFKALRQKLQDFSPVVGISKRCCPVCRELLGILTSTTDQRYIVNGYHSHIYACSLPPWLPLDVLEEMNTRFCRRLKAKLVKLVEGDILWNQIDSTGSRMSSNSDVFSVPVPEGHVVGVTKELRKSGDI